MNVPNQSKRAIHLLQRYVYSECAAKMKNIIKTAIIYVIKSWRNNTKLIKKKKKMINLLLSIVIKLLMGQKTNKQTVINFNL